MRNSTIKIKNKICRICQQSKPIFSRGRCAACAKKEDYKSIAKVSDKGKMKREAKKSLIEEDKLFYMEVWNASNERCYECNKKLSNPPSMLYFHHLLEKRNYPQFRHTHENLAILCADCHQQAESDLDKTPRTKILTEQIKKLLLP